ncbi:hypothetical protein [Chitinophaga sp. Cy-1792]|uniref:hypothetical protein n=1 Tax=Chitinophaga sp. Cy-1792 TaxID=2608339 RepID=UPI00141F4B7F|nr:hypothetical protein [Chitinophaga sp. Cy-1792]NIG55492.1 hypothetical protein [Chitinophaga sp. Cy-1792]
MRRYLLFPMLLLGTVLKAQSPDSARARMMRQEGPVAGKNTPLNQIYPLFILNGVVSDSARINQLKPEEVMSIKVLKSPSATSIYGEAGKNGVVLISTNAFVNGNIYKILSPYSAKYKEIGTCNDCMVYIQHSKIVGDAVRDEYLSELEKSKIDSITILEQPVLTQQYNVADKKYGVIVTYHPK